MNGMNADKEKSSDEKEFVEGLGVEEERRRKKNELATDERR